MILSYFTFLCKESAELFYLTTKNKDVTHITSVARDPHTQSHQRPDNSTGLPCGSAVKNLLQCRRCGFDPCVEKIPWRREWQPTPVFLGNLIDRGAWPSTLHGLLESRT